MNRSIRVVAAVTALACFVLAGAMAQAQGKKWALLIGVDRYDSRAISPLDFTVADAKLVATSLSGGAGFAQGNIFTMTSDLARDSAARPTRANVMRRFNALASLVEPEDTFLFFFSGHGFARIEGEVERHFLATVDADITSTETMENSMVSLNELRKAMKQIRARKVIFLIDACRSDPSLSRTARSNIRTASFSRDLIAVAKSAGNGLVGTAVFFACSEGERAWEMADKKQGAFSYYLAEGLVGQAGEPGKALTMQDLGDYVQQKVQGWAKANSKTQIPDLKTDGAAKIVIADRAGLPLVVANNPTEPKPDPKPSVDPVPNPAPDKPKTVDPKAKVNAKDSAEMVYVPAGEFMMGDDKLPGNPKRKEMTEGYWIYKYPVTVKQYKRFCEETGREMPNAPSANNNTWVGLDDHPIVSVSWEDAMNYAKWVGGSLPNMKQWEKAARGTDGRVFPWGDLYDVGMAWTSVDQSSYRRTSAPIMRTKNVGQSPYGVSDIIGNVNCWLLEPGDKGYRVIRGGDYSSYRRENLTCAYFTTYSERGHYTIGIRVVVPENR